MTINLDDYDFKLPPNLIANQPTFPRDHCRLMIVNRRTGKIDHCLFNQLPDYLTNTDHLVVNQSRVFPARLLGRKTSGGRVELLLLRHLSTHTWEVLCRPGLRPATELIFPQKVTAKVIRANRQTIVRFNLPYSQLLPLLNRIGTTPIPPYIHSPHLESQIRSDYQTVYAKTPGSTAAPTAGLHFTPELISRIPHLDHITLHVGLGTFQPLQPEHFLSNHLHREFYSISPTTVSRLNQAKSDRRRIIAVGTTTLRTLESALDLRDRLTPGHSSTQIFIYPPYKFRYVDSLITNFHLPRSSLMLLVSAFAGRDLIMEAYHQAIVHQYRFFSFGDAMWII